MPNKAIFSESIKHALKVSGRTQKSLAEKTGLQPSLINHYIHGKVEPSLTNMLKISNALGYNLAELFEIGYASMGAAKCPKVYMPDWLPDLLPDLCELDDKGQEAVRSAMQALIDAFKATSVR